MPFFTLGSEIHAGVIRADEFYVQGYADSLQDQLSALEARVTTLESAGGDDDAVVTHTQTSAADAYTFTTPTWFTSWTQSFSMVVEANTVVKNAWGSYITLGGPYTFSIGPDGSDNVNPIHETRVYIREPNTTVGASHDPVLNIWHFYVVTKDGNIVKFYVDGVLNDTQTVTLTDTSSLGTPNTTSYVGSNGAGNNSEWHNGSLRNFGLYNGVLTASEISSMYNNGNQITLVDGANATLTRIPGPT